MTYHKNVLGWDKLKKWALEKEGNFNYSEMVENYGYIKRIHYSIMQ